MPSDDMLRLQVASLASVLKDFDKIYGLDECHADLIDFCLGEERSSSFKAKVGILFCSQDDVDILNEKVGLLSDELSHVALFDVKFSRVSGNLMSVRFRIDSEMPEIALRTYIESRFDRICSALLVTDISLGKIESSKVVSEPG